MVVLYHEIQHTIHFSLTMGSWQELKPGLETNVIDTREKKSNGNWCDSCLSTVSSTMKNKIEQNILFFIFKASCR